MTVSALNISNNELVAPADQKPADDGDDLPADDDQAPADVGNDIDIQNLVDEGHRRDMLPRKVLKALCEGKTESKLLVLRDCENREGVTDMKARTMSLAHGRVIKATLDNLRTMSLAYGRVMKATIEHTKKNNHKLRLVITRPRASDIVRNGS